MSASTSCTMSTTFPFSIFRNTLHLWTLLSVIIALVTVGVHFFTLNVDQSSSLPLEQVRMELERVCEPAKVEARLAQAEYPSALSALVSSHTPPASLFAMHVWVEEAALLPLVHDTLRTVNTRLIASAPSTLTSMRRRYAEKVILHRLVRYDPAPEDLWLTDAARAPNNTEETFSSARNTHDVAPSGEDDTADAVPHAPTELNSEGAQSEYQRGPRNAFRSLEEARQALVQRASYQQLGLPTLSHTFAPDPRAEMQTMSVSLVRLPAALHASYLGWLGAPQGSAEERARVAQEAAAAHHGVHCERFDTEQFFCVLPPSFDSEADSVDKQAVTTALTSVLAQELGVTTFRDYNFLRLFFIIREQAGCMHAYRSLTALQQSMRDHPAMKVPHSVHPILTELRRLVRHKQFVLAARAADALQYHPLLTPQLYIPFDHNLVSHVLILLPVVSMLLLCVRFVKDRRFVNRLAAKTAAAATKAEAHVLTESTATQPDAMPTVLQKEEKVAAPKAANPSRGTRAKRRKEE